MLEVKDKNLLETSIAARKSKLSPEKRALLEKLIDTKQEVKQQSIQTRAHDGPLPLSFSQQRLWFLDQLVPNSPAYNVVLALHLQTGIEEAALQAAINAVIARHEGLRTIFGSENGKPFQVFLDKLEIELQKIDLPGQSIDADYEQFHKLSVAEAKTPFDLSSGPLVRFQLYRLGHGKSILLLNLHHIVTDGWSCSIFIKELVENYFAFVDGNPSPYKDLPIQYADFALWQKQRMSGKLLDTQLNYWKSTLESEDSGLELPLDYTRSPVQDFKGDSFRFVIPNALSASINELSNRLKATPFMVFMTALKVLLHKYTGQKEVFVGTPIANRTVDEIENLIGFFVNTLVLKTDLSNNPTFSELLETVKEIANEAYSHQDIPFELLVSELQPEREMSKNPLFQVCFVYQNAPVKSERMHQFLESVEEIRNQTSKFDLWIQLMEVDGELQGEVEFNSSIFNESTIRRFIQSYEIVLNAVVEKPELTLRDVPVLTEAQRAQIVYEWNKTEKTYMDSDRCLHELIEQQVQRTPNALALVCNDERLSYQELNVRANKLAHYLRDNGIQAESFVGIFTERSVEMVVALLGVLKAGAAYVPYDPSYQSERLEYMLEHSQPTILLTQAHLVARVPIKNFKIVLLDTDWSKIDKLDGENFASGADKESLTYLMYTSGSTGKPKGVLNTHKGLVNRLLWMQEKFGLDETDRVLQKTPFSFDVSVWEFFWPLMTGASLVMARPDGHKDPYYFASIIYQENITTLHFVPAMLQVFLEDPEIGKCTSLKRVICSGEALPYSVQQRFYARMSADLFNLYGPTEAAIDVTSWDCQRDGSLPMVPIGKPIANTQIYILDPYLNPVPMGVSGELHIGGIQVAKGYYRQPQLTDEKFIPNPFSNDDNDKLYKTGDLACFMEDGTIQYMGRIDFQIKVRGVRIEPGEIESTLVNHPSIREAVVLNRPFEHMPEHNQLVAYLIPVTTESVRTEEVGDNHWEAVFDQTYERTNELQVDPEFNLIGWDSSYTGDPIPAREMKVWVDTTNQRISDLGPGKVLEIGCGTGLLLAQLAPQSEEYWATEISASALALVEEYISGSSRDYSNVHLFKASAEELDHFASERFDTVVLNSVAQYFPSLTYLNNVLLQLVERVEDGGAIFVGDLRNYQLIEHFYACVELEKVSDDTSVARLNGRIQKNLNQELELMVDPRYFLALKQQCPKITHVEVQLKRGDFCNELTQFRYDIVLHIGKVASKHRVTMLDWDYDNLSVAKVKSILQSDRPEELCLAGIKNSRTSFCNEIVANIRACQKDTVGDFMEATKSKQPTDSVDPEVWWQLAEENGYFAGIAWDSEKCDGSYQVVLRSQSQASEVIGWDCVTELSSNLEGYANSPAVGRISRQLTPALADYLKPKLPDYMIPSVYMVVQSFPTDSNGKLDRRALPTPIYDAPETTENYLAATTNIEKDLAKIWSEVLGFEVVDISKTFFELGGDSILTINVVTKAREIGLSITPQDIFQYKSIQKLAPVVAASGVGALETHQEADVFVDEGIRQKLQEEIPDFADVYPVTVMQEQMLYRMLHTRESGVNFVHHVFRFEGKNFDPELMKLAWSKVLKHYPVLRTSFAWEGLDEPLQIVHKCTETPINMYDWRHLPAETAQHDLEAFIQKLRAAGTELKKAPHTKLNVFRVEEDSYYYIHSFNLALQDGWSYHLIMKKLFDCYEMLKKNQKIPEGENDSNNYRKFVAWQRQQDLSAAENFWKQELSQTKLPSPSMVVPEEERTEGVGRPYQQESTNFSLQGTEKLLAVAKKYHLTPYTIVQGMWALQLSRRYGTTDVVFGSIYSGRGNPQLNIGETVGLFFNILPVIVKVEPNIKVVPWLEKLQDKVHTISQYDYTPIEKIHEWAKVPRNKFLFESYLVNETFPDVDSTFNRYGDLVGATPLEFIHQTEHPLRLEMVLYNKTLLMNVNYYRDYFKAGEVLNLSNAFLELMEHFVATPDNTIAELLRQ